MLQSRRVLVAGITRLSALASLAADVAQARAATAGRTTPWTAEELTPLLR